MNILLLGSGGRENALSWKIKHSKQDENSFIAPGNAGTALVVAHVDLSAKDSVAL